MDFILLLLGKVEDFLWGIPMMVMLLGTGLYLTLRSGFFQVRKFPVIWQETVGSVFKRKKPLTKDGVLSPFESLSTALASTVGTGNMAGVATAIALGGPGAVFWMWVVAFLGMMTKMAEVTLAVRYRQKTEQGAYYGGPMYYIERGLGQNWKPLAVLFAVCALFGAIGIAPLIQPHTIADAMHQTYGIPTIVTGVVVAFFAGLVIIGGIKRIGAVAAKLVPLMATIYIIASLIIIFMNITAVPQAFAMIFTYAFQPAPVMGGFAGSAVAAAIQYGMARGMFSNEAGQGSAPMAHAVAQTDHPTRQGLWGAFETFFDTIVICSMTALVILTTGVFETGENGIALTNMAFAESFGMFGSVLISISILLFAYTSIIGWAFYWETAVTYLFGEKGVQISRWVYVIPIIFAVGLELNVVWTLGSIALAVMAIPNLLALLLLRKEFFRLVKEFFDGDYLRQDASSKEEVKA
ncbi:AGCS family alanine or glycine:cation symporter [Caldalkalibacillus uzonensis]|uniref:AGCS family alanine or glycine:cation symporter n=1 Tax=Caldalkalibacillus uzonensis TaxID=353224 RepID=A0ABU0CPS2_9BACI|nr:sodium:alanine symporter family protein [Caldalkalibacillus uzonensis]MDQ0338088.1 AGCS family alanine or glycine:cation symporter [Caldalkalibacillus uzonensis]